MTLQIAADNLNAANQEFADALDRLNPRPIKALAKKCEDAGADFLDLNPGFLSRRKEDRMVFLVETVQEATSLKLILDSPNPRLLRQGLQVCNQIPILNGVSLEEQKLEEILPLALEYKTKLVLLLMDKNSQTPASMEEKLALALELRENCMAAGMKSDDLIFDPVVPNLTWDDAFPRISAGIRTVRLMASGAFFGEPVHTMIGLSNLKSGKTGPYWDFIEEVCLTLFAGAGLSLVLANVLRPNVMSRFSLSKSLLSS